MRRVKSHQRFNPDDFELFRWDDTNPFLRKCTGTRIILPSL